MPKINNDKAARFILVILLIGVTITALYLFGSITEIYDWTRYDKKTGIPYFAVNASTSRNIATLGPIYLLRKDRVEQTQAHLNTVISLNTDSDLYLYEYGITIRNDSYVPPPEFGLEIDPINVLFDIVDINPITPTTIDSELNTTVVNNGPININNAIGFIVVGDDIYTINNIKRIYIRNYTNGVRSPARMFIRFNHLYNMRLIDGSIGIDTTLLFTPNPQMIIYKGSNLLNGYRLKSYRYLDKNDTTTISLIPAIQTPDPPTPVSYVTTQLTPGDILIISPFTNQNYYNKYAYRVYPSTSSNLADQGGIYSTPTAYFDTNNNNYLVYVATSNVNFEYGPVQ